ncbi:MAG: translation initiation factor IF-2, partial [Proteiniphilum sp.]|nr:translation initiation factor IF-2 [Proteiniphilum sp.]
MPIRLIKVSKNLNVGINSLVEFLHKKGIEIEANPNAKIEDEQYDILIAEFGKDKNIRIVATETREKMHRRDEKRETVAIEGYELPEEPAPRKKAEKETIETEIPKEMKPHFNVVGNIDLENLNKKKTEPKKEEPVEEKKQEAKKQASPIEKETIPEPVEEVILQPEPVVEKPATTKVSEEEIAAVAAEEKIDTEKVEEVKTEVVEKAETEVVKEISAKEATAEEVTAEEVVVEEVTAEETNMKEGNAEEEATEEEAETNEIAAEEEFSEVEGPRTDKLFRLNKNKLESNIVVKGSIDLDAINDRTRPPRKSRAQRKKERLEREQKVVDGKKLKDEKVKLLKKEAIDEKKKQSVTADSDEDSKKKKRKRIRTSKVNIDKPTTSNQSSRGDRKPSLRKLVKTEVNEVDVQKQIKETLARLTEKKGKKGGVKYRREKREASAHKHQEELKQQEKESRVLQLTEFVTANDLANMMNVPVTNIISTCMSMGVMVAINQRLNAETINIVAEEYGFKTQFVSAEVIEAIAEEVDDPGNLIPRPPIVTVMGHVDHGKTSLLDSIRSTNVIAGEAGGITQHIGAYNVQLEDGRKITFLDTPGHEAFTAMRARGAKATDVAIILVAADDNVMPQTVEAINHAGAAGVPIVFAINKIDKPGANPEKIKEKLAEMNYLVEDWGGSYQSQDISAKQGIGIQELLEKVLLEADMLELKANPNRRASGSIIESELDKGRGYISTVLVENGTLHQGDIVLAGAYFGRVKAMFNERNQRIEEARPAEPALILGLNGAPQAGDTFNVMETEQEARSIANRREQLQREQSLRTQKMLTLDDIGRRIAIGNFQQLNIIVKGDVDGS